METHVVGMSLQEAKVAYPGINMRVVKEDGISNIVHQDYRANRANVHVEKGVIIRLDHFG